MYRCDVSYRYVRHARGRRVKRFSIRDASSSTSRGANNSRKRDRKRDLVSRVDFESQVRARKVRIEWTRGRPVCGMRIEECDRRRGRIEASRYVAAMSPLSIHFECGYATLPIESATDGRRLRGARSGCRQQAGGNGRIGMKMG